jgi:hypothetical protein
MDEVTRSPISHYPLNSLSRIFPTTTREMELAFAMRAAPGDNHRRPLFTLGRSRMNSADIPNPFAPRALVVITLANPREKFWGMMLRLAPEGVSVSGVDLSSFEDLGTRMKEGEPFTPSVIFFPMHRIERAEADLPVGDLPSLAQRFLSKTGLRPQEVLTPPGEDTNQTSPLKDPA